MTRLEQFVEVLGVASRNYASINSLFNDFATNISNSISDGAISIKQAYHINGVSIAVPEGREYFTLSLAGRSVRFVLSARHEGEGWMMGEVRCYLVPSLADDKAHEKIEPFCKFEISIDGAVKADEMSNFPSEINGQYKALEAALFVFRIALDK